MFLSIRSYSFCFIIQARLSVSCLIYLVVTKTISKINFQQLAPLGHNAGNASALVGTIQMAIGASATAIVSVLHNHTAIPMAAVMCFCALAALLIFMLGRKIMIRRASEEITKEEDIEMISTL